MVRDLEQALFPVLGVGEGAFLVAEQLGIEKGGAEAGAVHLDEGRLCPRAQIVDHPRHPPLARAALAVEQHRGPVALRQQADLVSELLHAGGSPQRIEAVPGRALHQERLVDPPETRLVGDPRRGRGQVLHVHRLGEEVLGAELHGPDSGGDVRFGRKQDDRGVPLAEALQHLHAVDPGKVQVEDDHLGAEPVERGQARLAAQLPGDLVAELLEIVADAAEHIDVVIDEENRYGHSVTLNAVEVLPTKN
jgi:hypothetical protein